MYLTKLTNGTLIRKIF